MTKDDILTMASEAYCWRINLYDDRIASIARLQRFAALVVAAEREACAKVCDEQEQRSRDSSEKAKRERDKFMYHHCAVTAKWNAAAIRAKGQG